MKHCLLSVLFVLLLVFSSDCLKAQDSLFARRTIRDLTSDAMFGRGPSYRGDSIAASYIRRQLRLLKVPSLGNNYYQNYTYSTCSMEGQCWISLNGSQHRLKNYQEFRVAPWSQSLSRRNVEVIYLPLATFINEKKLHQFIVKRKRTIAECFVYIDASEMDKLDAQQQKRCKIALYGLKRRNIFESKGIMIGLKNLNISSFELCDQPHNYAYVEVLASAMGKKCKTIDVTINTQFIGNYHSQNVCGIIPGEVDTMMVFTAHYDHLGTMGDGYKYMDGYEVKQEGAVIFRGAHDNASGVAAVLDLARQAAKEKPHYTMVFMFFSGEEASLKGSTYAAQHPLIDFSKVRLLVNMDMFCGGEEGLMVFNAESENTKPFFLRLQSLNEALQVAPEIRPRKNAPNSDHWPFSELCPSIYVLTMGGPYGGYHDPADVCEKCGLENYNNYLLLISALAL